MEITGTTVLIKPDRMPERTTSGKLLVPKSSNEMKPEEGTVIQAGPMCDIAKPQMRVKFSRKAASVIVIDGEDHYLISEHKTSYYE